MKGRSSAGASITKKRVSLLLKRLPESWHAAAGERPPNALRTSVRALLPGPARSRAQRGAAVPGAWGGRDLLKPAHHGRLAVLHHRVGEARLEEILEAHLYQRI